MRAPVRVLVAALGLCAAFAQAGASAPAAQTFEHGDWQLACDNTRTCRAAGYSAEGDTQPASLLFTRDAGPGTSVEGELQLGDFGDDSTIPANVRLAIGGKSAGVIPLDKDGHADLPSTVVAALLKAFAGKGRVSFSAGGETWRISGEGATAVLLKMDDLQGRVGTPGALVRRGGTSESAVLPPLPAPRVQAVRIVSTEQPGDDVLAARVLDSVELPKGDGGDCPKLGDPQERQNARLWHLDAHRVLVAQGCWMAAYNVGDGYWVANARPPYEATLVTNAGNEFDAAKGIASQQKGRGMGDCGSDDSWTWDGARFVHSAESTSGLCRGVRAGGAWILPTVVMEVIPRNEKPRTKVK